MATNASKLTEVIAVRIPNEAIKDFRQMASDRGVPVRTFLRETLTNFAQTAKSPES
jgi:predicted DNA binding CopG/RHH family protein